MRTYLETIMRAKGLIISLILLLSAVTLLPGRAAAFQQDNPVLINNENFIKDARQAIDSVYNMDDKASNRILAPWKKQYPNDPIWLFWDGLETWWQILPDLENTSLDKKMFYQFSKTDYQCAKILSEDPNDLDALVVKSASNGFMARLYANRSDWISALQKARKAKDALDRIKEIDPSLPDIKFGLGIYQYYVAWLPQAFPVLKSVTWLLPDGDKEKGLQMLRDAAESSVFVKPEALYMLGRIYYEGEKNTGEAIQYFLKLDRMYPENGYYKRVTVHLFYDEQHYEEAMSLIRQYLQEAEQQHAPFDFALKEDLYAMQGRILYLYGEFDGAIKSFEQSREVSLKAPLGKSRENYLMSGYYLGEIYAKKKDKSKAETFFREVSRTKSDSRFVDLARKALNDLK